MDVARKRSLARMRFTTHSVNVMRSLVDACCVVINKMWTPFGRFGSWINNEAPWLQLCLMSWSCMIFPAIVIKYIEPTLDKDVRMREERERIRMCLQKGIDPFPSMQWRETIGPLANPDRDHKPKDTTWQWRAANKAAKKRAEKERQDEELRKHALKKVRQAKMEQHGLPSTKLPAPLQWVHAHQPPHFVHPLKDQEFFPPAAAAKLTSASISS